MGPSAGRPLRRRGAIAVALVSLALALLVVAPMGAVASPSNAVSRTISASAAAGGLTASATWNGINITTASTSSAGFHISFNGAVTILYTWSQPVIPVSGGEWSINDARLQIFYFGFALATRDITTSVGATSGTITMGNWSTGPLQYILEGTYLLTASLIATNGSTAWSQSFWVDVSAPFYILAALPLVLVLIAIYEVYSLCCSGKHFTQKPPSKGGAPPTTADTGSSTPVSEPPDPAVAATPPTGGAS